jgi:protein phosphatase
MVARDKVGREDGAVISLEWGSATNVGLVRTDNEDSYLAEFPVFAVADGMGGHAAGEVASAIAVERLRGLLGNGPATVETVSAALHDANKVVVRQAADVPSESGMGSTIVGLVVVEEDSQPYWLAFNVGDSRLYRLFDGTLTQVSVDHSEVQELVDLGAMTQEDARSSAQRNVITRAIGIAERLEPDFWILPPARGERFLICSDGLSNEVDDDAIAATLSERDEPSVIANRLVEKAVAAGGRDNVTVVIVDVVSVE